MKAKTLLVTIIFLSAAAALFADHATIIRSTVEYPPLKVLADEDIKTFFVDAGLESDHLQYLDLEIQQIPWQVRQEIDTYILDNIWELEELIEEALENRVVPNSGRVGYITIGSFRWRQANIVASGSN